MSRYRFALRPWWILSHLFVAAMVLGMVSAGIWQWNRLQAQHEREDALAARTQQVAAEPGDLADPGDFAATEGLAFRPVTATGTYDRDGEILVGSPTYNGTPGSWVITPLDLGDGTSVMVRRGWIANQGDLEAVPEQYRAPSGEVTVEGLVVLTETRGSVGPKDPSTGTLTRMARADVARMDEQVDGDLLPFVIGLRAQDPAVTDDDPIVLPISTKEDAPPHLSYTVQWFTFATMTVVVYALILRKKARELEQESAVNDEP